MGRRLRRVHLHRRLLRRLRHGPGHRHDHAGRPLYPWLPAQARDRAPGANDASKEDSGTQGTNSVNEFESLKSKLGDKVLSLENSGKDAVIWILKTRTHSPNWFLVFLNLLLKHHEPLEHGLG